MRALVADQLGSPPHVAAGRPVQRSHRVAAQAQQFDIVARDAGVALHDAPVGWIVVVLIAMAELIDAWVVGDEPCVQVDFTGMETYAKKA